MSCKEKVIKACGHFICVAVRGLLSSAETGESSAPCLSTDHLKSHEPRQGSPGTASSLLPWSFSQAQRDL